jgi:hypothetical protein
MTLPLPDVLMGIRQKIEQAEEQWQRAQDTEMTLLDARELVRLARLYLQFALVEQFRQHQEEQDGTPFQMQLCQACWSPAFERARDFDVLEARIQPEEWYQWKTIRWEVFGSAEDPDLTPCTPLGAWHSWIRQIEHIPPSPPFPYENYRLYWEARQTVRRRAIAPLIEHYLQLAAHFQGPYAERQCALLLDTLQDDALPLEGTALGMPWIARHLLLAETALLFRRLAQR